MAITRMSPASLRVSERGSAIIEFAFLLPILIVLVIILADLCILLDYQMGMIHLGREAANVLSRGAEFPETFDALRDADGALHLDGQDGQIILSRIERDDNGQPILVAQQSRGRCIRRASSRMVHRGTFRICRDWPATCCTEPLRHVPIT